MEKPSHRNVNLPHSIFPKMIAKLCEQPFSVAPYRDTLSKLNNTGAVVEFSGHVRHSGDLNDVVALELDYYAPLTQPAMQQLLQQAAERWTLNGICICHRVGRINLGELIVWVGAASAHRAEAFAAANFLMDRLKTDVPFWKKEICAQGTSRWVTQKDRDRISSAAHG